MLDVMLFGCADFYVLRFIEANQFYLSPIAFQGESDEGGDTGSASLFKKVVSLLTVLANACCWLSCRCCSGTSMT